MFRNRFLNSAAFFLKPDDGTGQNGDQGNAQGQNNGGNAGDAGAQAGQDGGGASGAGGEGEGDGGDDAGETEGDDGSQGAGGEGEDTGADEDDPYAGLTYEQRERLERHVNREIGWRDRQINRLTGKRRQAEEDTRTAGQIIDRNQRGNDQGKQASTPEEVRQAAQQLVAQEQYDTACNNTDTAGKKAYKDKWPAVNDRIRKMGGLPADDLADIVLSTDHPEVVLYSLAQDPDLYERVMGLPPAKRRAEFVKLGLKEPPKAADTRPSKRPGDAPPPPRALNGGNRQAAAQTVDLYKDNVDDEAWYRQRNETRRKKFSNAQ